MGTKLKFGLLLPHFGRNASFRKILDGVKRAEEYGFDSVWVRDHLVFRPHDFEPQGFDSQDTTHITYFESLSPWQPSLRPQRSWPWARR